MLVTGFFTCIGCNTILLDKFSRDSAELPQKREAKKVTLVGDVSASFGLEPLEIHGICLATGLAGTGSDPPESYERSELLKEMSGRDVPYKNQVLANPNTSLVFATGYLPPGVRKGDRFDLMITLPENSETTSLRGGYLMQGRMYEIYVYDRARKSKERGTCKGPILVAPKTGFDSDKEMLKRGRVLGGGVSVMDRPIGLRANLDMSKRDKQITRDIESAINKRFQMLGKNGLPEKMAKAKDDKHVELTIHPKYTDAFDSYIGIKICRYIDVVRCIPIKEREQERMARLETLEKRLLDATTASRASLELEALGKPAIDTLKKGITSPDVAVRFHSAQALAYLGISESAKILGEVAEKEPSYRIYALAALSALGDMYADDELRRLMNTRTAETRYGAFRYLTVMRPDDPMIRGEKLGDDTFTFCVVDTQGPPMIHVTRTFRAEIAIFGRDLRFQAPFMVEGANNVVVRSVSPTQVSITKFSLDRPEQKRTVSMSVEEVIRALSDVGASYPDILEILQEAVAQNALSASAFRVDAIPECRRENPYEKAEKKNERKKSF